MIVLGVDPGSRTTGWGVVASEGSHICCVDYGSIHTLVKGKDPGICERLRTIHQKIDSLIVEYQPSVMVVEGVFYAANVKSALTLGHVRGVILLCAATRGISLVEFSPLEVKKAVVGYGRADKRQVQLMVRRLLNLQEEPEPHDAADALALALCHTFNGASGRRRQRRWREYEIKS